MYLWYFLWLLISVLLTIYSSSFYCFMAKKHISSSASNSELKQFALQFHFVTIF